MNHSDPLHSQPKSVPSDDQPAVSQSRQTTLELVKAVSAMDEFLRNGKVRHRYLRTEVEMAMVATIAMTISVGGLLSEQASQAVSSRRALGAERDSNAPAAQLLEKLLANPIIGRLGENDPSSVRAIRELISNCPIVGEALRYFYLDENNEHVSDNFGSAKSALPSSYPSNQDLFGAGFVKFVESIARAQAPGLLDPEILRTSSFASNPNMSGEKRYRIGFFEISTINRRKVQALINEGVPIDDPLTSLVVVGAVLLTARGLLHEALTKKMEYLRGISPNFCRRPGGTPASVQSFVRSQLNPRMLELSRCGRASTANVERLEREVAEKYNLDAKEDMRAFRMLMFHRPSQLAEGSKELAKLGSTWTYRQSIRAILNSEHEELSFVANLFRICGADAVTLKDERVKVRSTASIDQLPDTTTIVSSLFAPRKEIEALLKERSPEKRDQMLAYMAAELGGLLANFDQIEFPISVTPEVQLRILDALAAHTEVVAELTAELSGLPLELRRPLTLREKIRDEALRLTKERANELELVPWMFDVVGSVFIDVKTQTKFKATGTTITKEGRPMLWTERYGPYENRDVIISPWRLRLMLKYGEYLVVDDRTTPGMLSEAGLEDNEIA